MIKVIIVPKLLDNLWVSGSLAGDCTLHIGETRHNCHGVSGRLACSQDVNPPQSLLCCEAPPFVCHLFTLLAQAIVVSTMRSRSTASWIGSGFFILVLTTLVTSERQWLRARRAIASSKAQRHSTYPIKSPALCTLMLHALRKASMGASFNRVGFWISLTFTDCHEHSCILLWEQI